ncbi:MAG: hypothetical protein Q4C03_02770 [bacterium]|nr:hypothetical protein [bacterium]
MAVHEFICCLCGKKFHGWGNNPYPVNKDAGTECCDSCDDTKVVPARIAEVLKGGQS